MRGGNWGQKDMEEGKGGINGDGQRRFGVVNTQYSVQIMFCRIVHLKPEYFVNHCHPNKFNKKRGGRYTIKYIYSQ